MNRKMCPWAVGAFLLSFVSAKLVGCFITLRIFFQFNSPKKGIFHSMAWNHKKLLFENFIIIFRRTEAKFCALTFASYFVMELPLS